ncbi:MAG: hypothetical protein H6513_07685 [Acidimicrobiaceae bacterium]|nr:hypothetical protein [Actinomycetota bacterium]MCB0980023.1 hypothetical protein [Ilumatobacter sp.]MCB9380560.1 hypothetical protein [Acidimicrobiaceae bacterium]
MAIERRVRFTEEFFDRLDELLPEERSADGTPSATDFLVFELPSIRDRLAADALDATLMTERSSVRISITSGVLVDRIALYMLVGSTEVVVFDLDLDIGWE